MLPDDQDSESKTASSQETAGQPTGPSPGQPCPICGAIGCDQPKDYQGYLAGSKPSYTVLSWKSLANALQSPGPLPVAKPQTISLPLDLHKGGAIHLTEEAAQLAMSLCDGSGQGSPKKTEFGPAQADHPVQYPPGSLGEAFQKTGKSVKLSDYYTKPHFVVTQQMKEAYEELLAEASKPFLFDKVDLEDMFDDGDDDYDTTEG